MHILYSLYAAESLEWRNWVRRCSHSPNNQLYIYAYFQHSGFVQWLVLLLSLSSCANMWSVLTFLVSAILSKCLQHISEVGTTIAWIPLFNIMGWITGNMISSRYLQFKAAWAMNAGGGPVFYRFLSFCPGYSLRYQHIIKTIQIYIWLGTMK